MRWKHTFLVVLTILMAYGSCAFGQIVVTPQESEVHSPVTATLQKPIPDGAQVQGGWTLSTGCQSLPAGSGSIHIWAPPGKHSIAYRGIWVKSRPFTIDGETIQILEGFGFLDESAAFVVKGVGPQPDPDPGPDPPPVPITRLGVMVIEDAEARTSLPYGQVQAMTLPDIRELPAVFRLVDKDNPAAGLAPWIALAKSYPWLVLHDVDSSRVAWQGPVPATAPAMRELLNKHKPKDVIRRALEQVADPKATITLPQPAQQFRQYLVPARIRR